MERKKKEGKTVTRATHAFGFFSWLIQPRFSIFKPRAYTGMGGKGAVPPHRSVKGRT